MNKTKGLGMQVITERGLTDWMIESIIRRNLEEANLRNGDVQVRVRKGVAFLSGSAASLKQKRLMEDSVRSIDGIRAVYNQVRVIPRRAMDDEWLRMRVADALKGMPFVRNITVHAWAGQVRVCGSVGNMNEKEAIERKVLEVAGAGNIDNCLEITLAATI